MATKVPVSITINGKLYEQEVPPRMLLVHFIRDVLHLTGTHIGCDTTSCGACTIQVDGQSVKSCTFFTVMANGKTVRTIEDMAGPDGLHPLQEGFKEEHGLQCGFCTPGMIMRTDELLRKNPNPTEDEIRHGIAGNLCRCTGYVNIVKAVQYAAAKTEGGAA